MADSFDQNTTCCSKINCDFCFNKKKINKFNYNMDGIGSRVLFKLEMFK